MTHFDRLDWVPSARVPLLSAIAGCNRQGHTLTAWTHGTCWMLWYGAIVPLLDAGCHGKGAIAGCHVVGCHCWMPWMPSDRHFWVPCGRVPLLDAIGGGWS